MRRFGWVLLAGCAAPPSPAAPSGARTPALVIVTAPAHAEAPRGDTSPERASLDEAITKVVIEEHTWPRPATAVVDTTPSKPEPEARLGHDVCAGSPLPKEKPRTPKATCCHPAKELLVRPIRAVYPAVRACYDARTRTSAEGRVLLSFRIEQDGSVKRVCAKDTSTMDDEPAARCMAEALRGIRYPAMSDDERDLCGLITITYPVVLEP